MSKNVILFGAGASFGSELNMPPLGSGLFIELVKFDQNYWGNILCKYKIIFDNDFEEGMKSLIEDSPFLVPFLQRTKALYFTNFTPTAKNLYYQLAKRLEQNPKNVSLATLNYDMLLQNSFKMANINLALFQKSSNGLELILPHGSCNLFCKSVSASPVGVYFDPLQVKINGDIQEINLINDLAELRLEIRSNAIPPIMSYFEMEKRTTAGEQYLIESRKRLIHLIENAESVVIIGVKIREHDVHIWDPIKRTNAKLIYCSGSDERTQFYSFTDKYRISKENHFIDGFWSDNFDEVFNHII